MNAAFLERLHQIEQSHKVPSPRRPETAQRCPGCGHASHRDECGAKGPAKCVALLDAVTGRPVGTACSSVREPCPCPLGRCHTCGALISGARPLPLGDLELDVDGTGAHPGGTLAVWTLADGTLAARPLAAGEDPGPGEYRGRAHVHQLAEAAEWLAEMEGSTTCPAPST